MSESVLNERIGNVVVITLNAPEKRNALSTEILHALAEQLQVLATDTECRAIVLTGAGDHFCSGGDVSAMTAERPILGSRQRIEAAHRVIRSICGGPKPIVAAVEGYAFGAGLSLVAACDYVVASPSGKFSAVFAKVGLIPDMGLLWTLPQRIGVGAAKKLFITARTVESAEALTLGLIDEISEVGRARDAGLTVAQSYAAAPPLVVAMLKSTFAKGCTTLDDALRAEIDIQPTLYLSADHQNAIAAFREKRAPEFHGV
ncbi:MAG: putative enoyl-CoA hydratase [Verrucomicrobiaceae bacterium]|nr:putative enoyl-CoA hydratase [Verrucomicrobiaceae bacterium]